MRVVINLVLFFVICGMVWMLISSIQEPIEFQTEKEIRSTAVTNRLMAIRASQDLFRQVSGEGYAPNFDTLVTSLKSGKIMTISVQGNPDDPNDPTITYDTSYTPVAVKIKELNARNSYKIVLDSLRYVPYTNNKVQFEIQADTLTYQQTLVNVVEVKTKIANYMGKYASPRYARYDATYNPSSYIKFGDLYAPNLTGNWE